MHWISNNKIEENATDSPHSSCAFCMFSICLNFHGKPRLSVVCQFYFILLRSLACIVKADIPPANQLLWSHCIRINSSSSNGDIGSYHMHQHSSRPKIYHSRSYSLARLDYRTCENVPKKSISHLWFVCGWQEKRQTGERVRAFYHIIYLLSPRSGERTLSHTHTHLFTPVHSLTAHSIGRNKFQAHFH